MRNFTIEHVRTPFSSALGERLSTVLQILAPSNNSVSQFRILGHSVPPSPSSSQSTIGQIGVRALNRDTSTYLGNPPSIVDARRGLFSGPLSSPLSVIKNERTHARPHTHEHTLARTDADAPKSQPSFDTPFPTSSDVLTTRNRQNTRTRRREGDAETQMG